jgi:hypothetical protein
MSRMIIICAAWCITYSTVFKKPKKTPTTNTVIPPFFLGGISAVSMGSSVCYEPGHSTSEHGGMTINLSRRQLFSCVLSPVIYANSWTAYDQISFHLITLYSQSAPSFAQLKP